MRDFLNEKAAGEALKKKAEKSGIPVGILRQVYNRGMAAWKTGHRPGATQQQWGYARVNSFITKGKGTWGKADADLAAKARASKKESVEIKEAKNAVSGSKVNKFVTGHNLTYKGKKYKELDLELKGIDNNTQIVTFQVLHPKEVMGNELKIPFKTLRRGPFMATDTSKVNESIQEKLGPDADAGDYIKDFRKSKAPQFKGKSDVKKQKMAIAAFLANRDKKEEVNEGMKYTHAAVDKKGLVIGFASDEKDAKDMARRKDGKVVKLKKPMSDKKGDMMVNRPLKEEVQEASKEGTIRIIDLGRFGKGKGFQVQRMTKGKFVNQGKPYKSQKDAEKVRKDGQHSMQFEAKKAPKIDPDKYAKHMAKNDKKKKLSSTQKSLADIRKRSESIDEATKYGVIRYPDTAISYVKNDGKGWEHIYDRSYGFKGKVDKKDLKHMSPIEMEKMPKRMREDTRLPDEGTDEATKRARSMTPGEMNEDADNFKSMSARIKKAKTVKDLDKLDKSIDRVYNVGALTAGELKRLDGMITDRKTKMESKEMKSFKSIREAVSMRNSINQYYYVDPKGVVGAVGSKDAMRKMNVKQAKDGNKGGYFSQNFKKYKVGDKIKEEVELDEKKQLHLFDNKPDAEKKAKEIGGKVVTGKGKSMGKFAAVKEAKNYEYKNGKVHISRKNFAKVHKDYKNTSKGKERMSVLDPKTQGTVSAPVVFTEGFSKSQLAKLKKAYEPLRGKRISLDNANKLRKMLDNVKDDKAAMSAIWAADIPFVSNLAMNHLLMVHNMKPADIKKLKESVLQEAEGNIIIKPSANADKETSDIQSLAKKLGLKVTRVAKRKDGGRAVHLSGNMKKLYDLQSAAANKGMKVS